MNPRLAEAPVEAPVEALVQALVPPSTTDATRAAGRTTGPVRPARRPPPLAQLPPAREGEAVYGLAAVDANGRIADRQVLGALRWVAGTRLDIRIRHGLLVVHEQDDGLFAIDGRGHLRLPAPARRWCGLSTADRVLLVARPQQRVLVIHPPTALDEMITHVHAQLQRDGDLT